MMFGQSVPPPSNRKFGLFFSAVFVIFSGYLLWHQETQWAVFLGFIGASFFFLALIQPQTLGGFNRAWMALGLLMGTFISPIVLGLMFFGLITPISLLFRLTGRDELRIRQKRAPSFWRIRTLRPDGQTTSFKDQY